MLLLVHIVLYSIFFQTSTAAWTCTASWSKTNGFANCSNGRAANGACVATADPSMQCGKCGSNAIRCSEDSGEVDGSSAVTKCGAVGQQIECPLSFPSLIAVCGTLVNPCNFKNISCQSIGILCAREKHAEVTISDATCDWVAFSTSGLGECESDEIAAGLCVAANQKQCGGSANNGKIKCCLPRTQSCAPVGTWRRIASGICDRMTAVAGVCSVRCDPLGIFGFRLSPGLFACHGRVYTRNATHWESACELFPSCPPGAVAVSFTQCLLSTGPGTRVQCQALAYATIDLNDCVTYSGNDDVWCPAEHYAVAVCGPNRPLYCPGGVDTMVRCCRVRSYHNMGPSCSPDMVYSVVGNAPVAAPYGTAGVGNLDITAVGHVNAVAACGDALLVAVNEHVIYMANLKSERIVRNLGVFGSGGYIDSPWRPASWSSNGTLINSPVDLFVDQTTCNEVFVTEQANFIVRAFQNSPSFELFVAAGVYSTTPSILTNNSATSTAQLSLVRASLHRQSTNELFISTIAAVVVAEMGPPKMARYFVGDGVTQSLASNNVFRTESKIANPEQMVLQDDALLFVADYDSATQVGAILIVDLSTGILGLLNPFPQCNPSGLAIYERATLFVSDSTAGCIWKVNLDSGTVVLFAGTCGSSGFVDRTSRLSALFSTPKHLAVSNSMLFIADQQNLRVRVIDLAVRCSAGFDSFTQCTSCAAGYFGYPRCRQSCTIADDCSYRASSVSGVVGNCLCVCIASFSGTSCQHCQHGLDMRNNCTACIPGYVNFPFCRTASPSLSISSMETMTVAGSGTVSITPPESRTRTRFATPSSSLDPTSSHALSLSMSFLTRTKSARLTDSIELTVTFPLSQTLMLSETRTVDQPPSLSFTLMKTVTQEVSESSTMWETRSLTDSSSTTQTLTSRISATITLTALPTQTTTLQMTRTETASRPIGVNITIVNPPDAEMTTEDIRSHDEMNRRLTFFAKYGEFDLADAAEKEFWSRCIKISCRRSSICNILSQSTLNVSESNVSHLHFSVPRQNTFLLFDDENDYENIFFNFSSDCFLWTVDPRVPSPLRITAIHPPQHVPQEFIDVAVALNLFTGLLSGLHPSFLTSIFSPLFLWRLAEKKWDSMHWIYHPLQTHVGGDRFKNQLAAATLNTVVVLSVSVIHGGIAHFQSEIHDEPLSMSFARMYFPSYSISIWKMLLFPTCSCALTLIIAQNDGVSFVYAIALLWIASIVASCVPILITFDAKFVPWTIADIPRGFKRFFVSGGSYEDGSFRSDSNSKQESLLQYGFSSGDVAVKRCCFCRRFACLVDHFKIGHHAYSFMETLILLVFAVCDGVLVSQRGSGGFPVSIISAVSAFFFMIANVIFRSHLIPFRGLLFAISSIAQLASAVLSIIALRINYPAEELFIAAAWCAVSALLVPVMDVGCSIGLLVLRARRKWQTSSRKGTASVHMNWSSDIYDDAHLQHSNPLFRMDHHSVEMESYRSHKGNEALTSLIDSGEQHDADMLFRRHFGAF